jgi:hypothetical protein
MWVLFITAVAFKLSAADSLIQVNRQSLVARAGLVFDAGDDVFYMTASGKGLTARVLAWPNGDVMAVEIDDQRETPAAINIDLRMLRYQGQNYRQTQEHEVIFRTAGHTATSKLGIDGGRIALTQQFREGESYGSSGVAIGVVGRASRARYLNESTVQLSVAPGKGRFDPHRERCGQEPRARHGPASARPGEGRCGERLRRLAKEDRRVVGRLLNERLRVPA